MSKCASDFGFSIMMQVAGNDHGITAFQMDIKVMIHILGSTLLQLQNLSAFASQDSFRFKPENSRQLLIF